jgi:hypothetical protein
MKLRIRGNSVRLRLTRGEVARFAEKGLVEEAIEFGFAPPRRLIYALQTVATAEKVGAAFDDNRLSVSIPKLEAEKWTSTNQISIEARQSLGDDKYLRILIEKDFACLETRLGEDESDAFPHPLEGKAC